VFTDYGPPPTLVYDDDTDPLIKSGRQDNGVFKL
jgi:hypothetical protein